MRTKRDDVGLITFLRELIITTTRFVLLACLLLKRENQSGGRSISAVDNGNNGEVIPSF